jgi:selenocysteine lyase/cysteine desulfurase
LRPWNTGWFADFSSLEKPADGTTNYSNNGYRFGGSTMDFSALYRLLSVFQLFESMDLTNEKIHHFIQNRQASFLSEIEKYDHPLINKKRLLVDDLHYHGHFFTFQLDSAEQVEKMCSLLREYNIITDFRGDRLRFGFALYHPEQYDLSVLNTRRAYFFDEFLFS